MSLIPGSRQHSRIRRASDEKPDQTDFPFPKFTVGFIIFAALLVLTIFYPLIVTNDPLEMVGQGNFFKPGTYISVSEAVNTNPYTLNLNASSSRLEQNLSMEERMAMADWLNQFAGISSKEMDVTDAGGLVSLWKDHYDSTSEQKGLIAARKKYFSRLDKKITGLLEDRDVLLAEKNQETGEVSVKKTIPSTSYVNVKDVGSRRVFILGTDNFGRDVLTELVAAIKTSLKIGFIAGLIATTIGLSLGLIAGYLGGIIDDFILFITNLFTVIPSFILLILISYSIGKNARGVMMVAIIIGLTSWTWTTRSVRSQVISLRNRDHVNLSKLSGHSLFRIILTDILPYIASYVVMALILQISSGILAEAQLSMIGLGLLQRRYPLLVL